ncbi:unannotated protein [freshwater metagenome]|jgi:hypothetical protein|uniref:Unannotated protein n=1 Tax=freshwater metagenome TaxID=449393 RepID=A0A6J6UV27_9ZZZZ|nr:hypothetical protein [Actinomycetota bacterium]
MSTATLEGLEGRSGGTTALWLRRGFVGLLALGMLAALLGLLGDRTERVTATSADGRWTLSLLHARLSRAGLDVPWEVTVTRRGGFEGPVVLGVTGTYFDLYETQGFRPEPSASYRDAQTLFLEFEPPPSGDVLVVAYDAYIQPASRQGSAGTVAVRSGEEVLVGLDFSTGLLP